MDHTEHDEFEIISNVLISLVVKNGGVLEVPRNWSEIRDYMVMREYDPERNSDIFTLMGKDTPQLPM